MPLSESLFAHIFNDPFLTGSFGLEGNLFRTTVGYLEEYLDSSYYKALPDAVSTLFEVCHQFVEYEKTIVRIKYQIDLRDLVETVYADIKKLKKESYLLFPGGWAAAKGSHAIIYQFEKDIDGNILFSLINSGAGIEYHEQFFHNGRLVYNPIKKFRIPKANTGEEAVFIFLLKLIKYRCPAIHKLNTVKAEDIYKKALSKLAFLDAEIIPSTELSPHLYTQGQLSGTCAQRSIHQMLKVRFNNLDEYRRFIYGFKMYALDEYIVDLKAQNKFGLAQYQSQVKKAIRHSLRLLLLMQSKDESLPLFNSQEREIGLNKLRGYLSLMAEALVLIPKAPKWPLSIKTKPIINIFYSIQNKEWVDDNKHVSSSLVMSLDLPDYQGGQNLFKEMSDLRQLLRNQRNDLLKISHLEHFFISIPLAEQDDFYSLLSDDKSKTQFYELFFDLYLIYARASYLAWGDTPLPRRYLIDLSVLALLKYQNKDNFISLLIAGKVDALIKGSFVFLANNDPKLDARFAETVRILESDESTTAVLSYYGELVNNDPQFSKLEAHFAQSTVPLQFKACLQRTKYSALYQLINHRAVYSREFDSLLTKLGLYESLEEFIFTIVKKHTGSSILLPWRFSFNLKIFYEEERDDVCYSRPADPNLRFLISPSLVENKYNPSGIVKKILADNIIFQQQLALFNAKKIKSRSDNQTQLFPLSSDIDEENTEALNSNLLEERELLHLRQVPSGQIALTIDYFYRHIAKLERKELQVYFEANLFQPGLLLFQLNNPNRKSYFLKRWGEFIRKGMHYYEGAKAINSSTLFLIRQDYLVNQYVFKLEPHQEKSRFLNFYHSLQELLKQRENKAFYIQLHYYLFLTLVDILKFDALDEAQIEQALYCYFNTQFIAVDEFDKASMADLQLAKLSFQVFLQKQHFSNEQILKLLCCLGFSVDSEKAQIKTDEFIIAVDDGTNAYQINLLEGIVYKNELSFCPIPLDILAHPLIRQLNQEGKRLGFKTQGQEKYFIESPGGNISIATYSGNYFIQKQWPNDQGQLVWFAIRSLSYEQMEKYGFDFVRNLLPDILATGEYCGWVEPETGEMLLSEMNNPVWRAKKGAPFIHIDNAKILCQSNLSEKFNSFEAERFMLVSQVGNNYEVELPRYGLTFIYEPHSKRFLFEKEGEQYQLDEKTAPLAEGISSLFFVNNEKSFVLIPVQPFIKSTKREEKGEYRRLKQDRKATIPREKIEDYWAKNYKKGLPFWRRKETEKHVLFTLEDGKPRPETMADVLYLIYLYLGANEPEKAWQALDDCERRFASLSGTYEELNYLNWIFNYLPFNKDANKDTNNNPMMLNCKLRALSLLARFKYKGNQIKFPEAIFNPVEIYTNDEYERLRLQENKAFDAGLVSLIRTLYPRMQLMRRDCPAAFVLSPKTCRALLSFYYLHNERLEDSLGEEWASLSLVESQAAFEPTSTTAQLYKTASTYSETLIDIDIDRKEAALLIDEIAKHCKKMHWDELDEEQQERFWNELKPSIKYRTLMAYAPYYLLLSLAENYKLKVADFARKKLLADYLSPPRPQKRAATLLTKVLYLLAIEGLKRKKQDTYEIIIGKVAEKYRCEQLSIRELSAYAEPGQSISALKEKLPPVVSIPLQIDNLALDSLILIPLPASLKPYSLKWHDALALVSKQITSVANERELGYQRYQTHLNLKTIANEAFSVDRLNDLDRAVDSSLEKMEGGLTHLKDELLKMANLGPKAPFMKQIFEIDIASERKMAVTLPLLLRLYLYKDAALYRRETGLTLEEIKALHQKTALFLLQSVAYQQTKRIKVSLNKLNTRLTAISKEQLSFKLAELLFSENIVDVNETALMVLQYYENILIRPKQKRALTLFLNPRSSANSVQKLPMGMGKSTVILPLYLALKQEESKLVIALVPSVLLKTNFADLYVTSAPLCKENVHVFTFSRQDDCSPQRLEQIYNLFNHVRSIISTGESLQSLDLKFFELLFSYGNKNLSQFINKDWEAQVKGLNKILLLLLKEAELMSDEIHKVQSSKEKLQYSLGEIQRISSLIFKSAIELYQFFKSVPLDNLDNFNKKGFFLFDLIKNNALLTSAQYEKLGALLAFELVYNTNSPWLAWLTKENINQQELLDYLNDQSTAMPDWFDKVPAKVKLQCGFYKAQIRDLLASTLKRNLYEHYGPSAKGYVAIPYAANNIPKEQSLFGNFLETINYSIQFLLINGLPQGLLNDFLASLYSQANQELFKLGLQHLDETNSGILYKKLFGHAISTLNLKDKSHLDNLYHLHRWDEILIYAILEQEILPNIVCDNLILQADSFNLVDMVACFQGLSGTPFNHSTFHHRLKYDEQSGLGDDAYVVASIKTKNIAIRHFDFSNADDYIKTFFMGAQDLTHFRAIIDIAAAFTGITNLQVAKALARQINAFKDKFSSPIKYILYFNEQQAFCALSLNENKEPLILDVTKPELICQTLKCEFKSIFTFYDQAHSEGTNLLQDPEARAFVTVNHQTCHSPFLQGITRMRDLVEGNQSIEIITSSSLENRNLDSLLEMMKNNEDRQLRQDNFDSALANMAAIIRANLRRAILLEENVYKKVELCLLFKDYFVKEDSLNLFAKYGGINKNDTTKNILENYQRFLIGDWQRLLLKAKKPLTEETFIESELQKVVNKALQPGVCAERQARQFSSLHEHKEVQTQIDVAMHVETFKDEVVLKPRPYCSWTKLWPSRLETSTLNDICKSANTKYLPHFSDNISCSINFYAVHLYQKTYVDFYLKPIYALLFNHVNNNSLECIILSQKEYSQLDRMNFPESCWISTTQHTVLKGAAPSDIKQNEQYQLIIEQIRFFNGEFDLLSDLETPLIWLLNEPRRKIQFFKEVLAASRDYSQSHFKQFRDKLLNVGQAYHAIGTNFELYNEPNFDWQSSFPEAEPEELEDYCQLAKLLLELEQSYWSIDIDFFCKTKAPSLSLRAQVVLETACIRKQSIKKIWQSWVIDAQCTQENWLEACAFFPQLQYYEEGETALLDELYISYFLLKSLLEIIPKSLKIHSDISTRLQKVAISLICHPKTSKALIENIRSTIPLSINDYVKIPPVVHDVDATDQSKLQDFAKLILAEFQKLDDSNSDSSSDISSDSQHVNINDPIFMPIWQEAASFFPVALRRQSELPKACLLIRFILEQARALEPKIVQELNLLLKKGLEYFLGQPCSEDSIKEIMEMAIFSPEEWSEILDDLDNENVYLYIAKHAHFRAHLHCAVQDIDNNFAIADVLLGNPYFCQFVELFGIIANHQKVDLEQKTVALQRLFERPECDDFILISCINKTEHPDIIDLLLEKALDENWVNAVSKIIKSKKCTTSMLRRIFNSCDIAQLVFYFKDLELAYDVFSLESIIKALSTAQIDALLETSSLTLILDKGQLTESQYLKIINNKKITPKTLSLLARKIESDALFDALIDAYKSPTLGLEIIENPKASSRILQRITGCLFPDCDFLSKLLKHPACNEAILDSILKDLVKNIDRESKTNLNEIAFILAQKEFKLNSAGLEAIMEHPHIPVTQKLKARILLDENQGQYGFKRAYLEPKPSIYNEEEETEIISLILSICNQYSFWGPKVRHVKGDEALPLGIKEIRRLCMETSINDLLRIGRHAAQKHSEHFQCLHWFFRGRADLTNEFYQILSNLYKSSPDYKKIKENLEQFCLKNIFSSPANTLN